MPSPVPPPTFWPPTYPSTGDWFCVRINYTYIDVYRWWSSHLFYTVEGEVPDFYDQYEMINYLQGVFDPPFQLVTSEDYWVGYGCYWGVVGGQLIYGSRENPYTVGLNSVASLPNTQSLLMQKYPEATSDVGPGRVWIPGIPETFVDENGRFTSTAKLAIETLGGTLIDDLSNQGIDLTPAIIKPTTGELVPWDFYSYVQRPCYRCNRSLRRRQTPYIGFPGYWPYPI